MTISTAQMLKDLRTAALPAVPYEEFVARKMTFVFDRVGILALSSEMPAGCMVCDSEDPGRKTGPAFVGRN